MTTEPSETPAYVPPEMYTELMAEFEHGTMRGLLLICASNVDWMLGLLLRAFLVDDIKIVDQMLTNDGPLASFSARIKAAYCLGLISKPSHDKIHLLRSMRNDAAHNVESIAHVEDRVATLYHGLAYTAGQLELRNKIVVSATSLMIRIGQQIEAVERRERKADDLFVNPTSPPVPPARQPE